MPVNDAPDGAHISPYDVAIIGAGVVGCALARRLTLDGARVVVLEKATDVLDGASKANSAILHTGFDAPPGSLEQQCLAQGYAEYLDLASAIGLPVLRCGALVLAWTPEQLDTLPELINKAHRNRVSDVAMVERAEILRREPGLSPALLGGFEVPGESLIDPWSSAHSYLDQAILNGASVWRNTEVIRGSRNYGLWELETTRGPVLARWALNCAGLYGDVVDERLTGHRHFTITPRKGQFLVFDKSASRLASAIILPVPTKTTKGVVICRTVFGNLLVGPTAEDQKSRTDASTSREMLHTLEAMGQKILPDLVHHEVTATYAGLRPATEFQDYQIRIDPQEGYGTVGGIRSTGLSAALGIAKHVAGLMPGEWSGGPLPEPVLPPPDRLSDYHTRDWEAGGHDGIVCHCERVTRREIAEAFGGPLPPASLAGLKRRTRATMGRCQGFYCIAELARLTKGRFDLAIGQDDEQ